MLYADVIIDLSADSLDKTFQYKIPEALKNDVDIGTPVKVKFGTRKSLIDGYVLGISTTPKIAPNKIKEIAEVNSRGIEAERDLIKLAIWMANTYGSSLAAALRTVLPIKRVSNGKARKEVSVKPYENSDDVELNEEQKIAIDTIKDSMSEDIAKTYLLHGVTGSGKTVVYIKLIEEVLAKGQQAIVLIPEIALTYQTLSRFYAAFGDRVATINSRMSAGEKYKAYLAAKENEVQIIIGPRSALFSPFMNLGIIIIDEEHESSYKSEPIPRYHAIEVAKKRAEMSNATLVLGSATPSMTSYYHAKCGDYELLTLKNRATANPLATCEIIDLRQEFLNGNKSIISDRLHELMDETLKKNEQIMLFVNRRGLLGFVSCRACGEVLKCPHCDVSLSLHKYDILKCHYCGYEEKKPKQCPKCGSKHIAGFRAGTQMIEKIVSEEFEGARVLRMDFDTTRKKGEHEEILSSFANHDADILIGTQMIVKGHNFKDVTLVGVLAADISLNGSDYTSTERTFNLITQAVGRAGRGDKPGCAVIQTYRPEHYSVTCASNQDYEGFYEHEIGFRSLMSYPPVVHMLLVIITSKSEEMAAYCAGDLKSSLSNVLNDSSALLGPSDAVVAKVRDVYRKLLYIKNPSGDELIKIKDYVADIAVTKKYRDTSISFDFDPIGGF